MDSATKMHANQEPTIDGHSSPACGRGRVRAKLGEGQAERGPSRARAKQEFSAYPEKLAGRRFPFLAHAGDHRRGRAFAQQVQQGLQISPWTFGDHLNFALPGVTHPADQPQSGGAIEHEGAEADPLDDALHKGVQAGWLVLGGRIPVHGLASLRRRKGSREKATGRVMAIRRSR
jgi:hypothetical protein